MPVATSALFEIEPDAAGPEWFLAHRRQALALAASAPAPDPADEVWRYSRVDDLAPAGFDVDLGARSAIDGVDAARAAGVFVGLLVDHPDPPRVLTETAKPAVDRYAGLADGLCAAPLVIDVPRGVRLVTPIVVRPAIPRLGGATYNRLLIRVADDAQIAVVEEIASPDHRGLVVCRTDTLIGAGARVAHGLVQTLGSQMRFVANHSVQVGASGTASLGAVALGGRTARMRTDCLLSGRGATADLTALFSGHRDQMHDVRTFQRHEGRDTTSELLFKGVLRDRARSVYTGLIRIEPDARGSSAFQTNRNLKLSDDAWAESVPNLEIECRDVHCSHASTVSPLDEDQLFYLASRGVPPEPAGRLIVAGFFDEVIRRFPVESWRDAVAALVARDVEGAP